MPGSASASAGGGVAVVGEEQRGRRRRARRRWPRTAAARWRTASYCCSASCGAAERLEQLAVLEDVARLGGAARRPRRSGRAPSRTGRARPRPWPCRRARLDRPATRRARRCSGGARVRVAAVERQLAEVEEGEGAVGGGGCVVEGALHQLGRLAMSPRSSHVYEARDSDDVSGERFDHLLHRGERGVVVAELDLGVAQRAVEDGAVGVDRQALLGVLLGRAKSWRADASAERPA